MEFYGVPNEPKRFSCSIKSIIQNQKAYPKYHLLAHVLADLCTYAHRVQGIWVDSSSPQPIIDAGICNFKLAKPFMIDPQRGLQSRSDYQFVGIKQNLVYQNGNHHTFDDVLIIKEYEGVKRAILDNFCEVGPKLPIAANLKKDNDYVLITGVDVTNENEELHSVEFRKSSGGYTKLAFSFFAEAIIFVPVLDVETRRQIYRFGIVTLNGHKYDIKDMCFSAGGTLLATASEDGVRIVDLRDPSSKHIECARLKMHDGSRPTTLCFAEDLSIVVASESETTASLCMFGEDNLDKKTCCVKWQKDKDALPRKMPIGKLLGATLNGSPFLLTNTEGASIRIWHGQDYLQHLSGGMQVIDNISAISPNGHYIAAATATDIVRVWILSDGKHSPTKGESSQQAEEAWTLEQAFELKGHKAVVTSLCFTPDSQRIFGASKDGSVNVWDINDPGSESQVLDPTVSILYTHQDFTKIQYYEHISISPNGKMLAVAGDSLIRWIYVESMKILETIGRTHKGSITCMTWAPVPVCVGGKEVFVLATAGADKDVKLWTAPKVWVASSES